MGNFISKDEFMAGTFAGWAQVLSGQPFDNVKFRMAGSEKKLGMGETLKSMIATPSSFYKGMSSPLVCIGLAVSIQFGVFKSLKKFIQVSFFHKGKNWKN